MLLFIRWTVTKAKTRVEHGIRSNVLPRAVESPRRRKSKTQLAEQKKTIQHKNAAGLIAKELIVASSLKGAVIPMGSTAEDLPCVHTVLFALLDNSPTRKGLWQAPERNSMWATTAALDGFLVSHVSVPKA